MTTSPLWRQHDVVLTALLDGAQAKAATRAAAAGLLAKIREGVYVRSDIPPAERSLALARAHLDIAGALAPGGVITGVSALNGGALAEGNLFVAYRYPRVIEMPGLTLRLVPGKPAIAGDMPYKDGRLHFAGRARTLLENVVASRAKPSRTAGRDAVRSQLQKVLETQGEDALNQLRDDARAAAPALELEDAFKVVNEMIARILATHPAVARKAPAMLGIPVDRARIERFTLLAQALRAQPLAAVASRAEESFARRNLAFIESYFSNYIEGTEFSIEEAIDIGIHGNLPRNRPKDAHDILGVMKLAENPTDRRAALPPGPAVIPALEDLHRRMLEYRAEANPGLFKTRTNRAGNTTFVLPELARGTLIEGSQLLPTIPEGLARAIYAGFLVSAVHPFDDGNGRVSRIAMNAELSARGLQRVVVPTLVREEYLDCQRALSRDDNPQPIIRLLAQLQAWAAAFDYRDLVRAIEDLRHTNAFQESRAKYRLLSLSVAEPTAEPDATHESAPTRARAKPG